MTTTTQRPAPQHEAAPQGAPDRLSLYIKLLAGLLVLLVAGFGTFYWWDRRLPKAPSMNEQAISQAEAAVRKSPGSVEARLNLASAYELDKRYDDAIKQCDEILKVSKKDRAGLLARGYAYFLKGDLDKAAADYQSVITVGAKGEFSGSDTLLQEAYYYRGTIYEKQGKHQQALDTLNLALKINKADSDALYEVGQALDGLGRTKEAVDVYNRALSFVPTEWPEPYVALAKDYATLGKKDEAAYATAMASFAKNDLEGASSQLEALTESSTVKANALIALGLISRTQGQSTEALTWYTKALAADPKNAEVKRAIADLKGATATPSTHS